MILDTDPDGAKGESWRDHTESVPGTARHVKHRVRREEGGGRRWVGIVKKLAEATFAVKEEIIGLVLASVPVVEDEGLTGGLRTKKKAMVYD